MAENQSMVPAIPKRDRVSELPFMILLHILSLLPRKEAVRSGALSPKWKDLWKQRFPYPTMLSFGSTFQSDNDQAQIASEIELQMSRLGDKKIETFKLYFNPGDKYKEMTARWIQKAIANKVEELYLDFSQGVLGVGSFGRLVGKRKRFEGMDDVFGSNNTLNILSLSYFTFHRSFEFRCFSSLETLYLHGNNMNNHMFEQLLQCCQRLRALELRECLTLHYIKIMGHSSRCLQKLTIANCLHLQEVDVVSPSLHSFHFLGRIPRWFCMPIHLPNLTSVIIVSTERDRPVNSLPMYMAFQHVQVLTLCSSVIQFILRASTPAVFNCLNVCELQLLLGRIKLTDANLRMIYNFLSQSQFPILERLFIELLPSSTDYSRQACSIVDRTRAVFQQLKMIKITTLFSCHKNEMQLLDFLLRASVDLENLILVVSNNNIRGRISLRFQLLQYPNLRMLLIDSNEDDHSIMPMHTKQVIRGFHAREPQLNGPTD